MFDFDMAYVIVIGFITVIAGFIGAAVRKIGKVFRVGGEEDRPDPSAPPEDFFEQGGDQ